MRLAPIALVLVACSSPSATPGDKPTRPPTTAKEAGVPTLTYGDPIAGLAVALELPPGAKAGSTVEATLHFKNAGTAPIRIYFLEPEPFRSFQSRFSFRDAGGRPMAIPPDISPPHGYLPRESDFPLLEPGQERTYRQTLDLTDPAFAAGGRFTVVWRYSNEVTELKAGVQTLDGPSPVLFGGGPIPYIWTGEMTASAALELTAP